MFSNKKGLIQKAEVKSELLKELDAYGAEIKASFSSLYKLIENYPLLESDPPSPIEMTTFTKQMVKPKAPALTKPEPKRWPATDQLTESTFDFTASILKPNPLSESFIEVKKIPIPVRPDLPKKNKPQDILRFISDVTKTSFHEMRLAEKISNPKMLRFFKYNETPYMSELEAAACHFYRLIAPNNVPSATSHYDEHGKTTGLSSVGVPNFKNLMQDPLTDEDLKNDEIVKGLAIGLTTSYIFEEDDLHRCNMNKYGMRIDFDMSIWPILYDYKQGGIDVTVFRKPTEKTFCVTERNIVNFPNIVDGCPFYWPTNPPPVIKEPFRSMAAVFLPISNNAYKASDNAVFKKLEKHPVFVYHKYKTLLKYILTDEDMYRNIAKLHLNENVRHRFGYPRDIFIVDVMAEHQGHRLKEFREILSKIPEFREFIMGPNGAKAINEIIEEFAQRNKKIDSKIGTKNYLVSQYVATDKISERYNEIVVNVMNNTVISFPSPYNEMLNSTVQQTDNQSVIRKA